MKFAVSKFIYLVIAVLLCGQVSWALAPNPPEPPQGTPPPGGDIDSSIAILVIAAVLYGAYVVIRKTKTTATIKK